MRRFQQHQILFV